MDFCCIIVLNYCSNQLYIIFKPFKLINLCMFQPIVCHTVNSDRKRIPPGMLIFFFGVLLLILIHSCNDRAEVDSDEHLFRSELISKLYKLNNEDSLQLLANNFKKSGNKSGAMLTFKRMGNLQRENSRFTDALSSHQSGLSLAMELNDTLELVQALNNIGTDFRRIGAMSEASDYHFQALTYAEAFSGVDTPTGMKNRVVSLNGIGNVSLTLGYNTDAEIYFRKALKDEIKLKSYIGQAINLANIGALFEQREEYDSARVYYERSMEQNVLAKSDMGIGLCHIHLGNLHKAENDYEQAKAQYQYAYELMENINDRWHWLEACISIAEIHLLTGNVAEYRKYIRLAEETAVTINSPEHLSVIYQLKHQADIKTGNYVHALNHYKQSIALQDSVQGIKKTALFLDMRINYERQRNIRQLQEIEAENRIKQAEKQRTLYLSWFFILAGILFTAVLLYAYRQRTLSNRLLREIEKTRTSFFTNITHEFRTPLTVIQGLNHQLLVEKDLTEKEKDVYMKAINRQSNNLLGLVNQLLEIAKLEKGIENHRWKHGDIVSYLRMTAEAFQIYAGKQNVNLVFYSELPSIEMDFVPFYIDKIASNLLSNAIKHTTAYDRIDFTVGKNVRSGTLFISVADTGEGIAEKDLKHIFEMFYQSPNAKNITGTGIGLAFTRILVEKMGGKIEVESKPGIGSVFNVTLPLKNKELKLVEPLGVKIKPLVEEVEMQPSQELSSDEIAVEPDDDISAEQPSLPLVLLVEDNSDVLLYLEALLSEKYKILTARNGEQGLKVAEQHIPDLVITDIMMPVKDGSEMCCEMKSNLLLNHIPVIMLTAKTTRDDLVEGLRCGADAYIRKPFSSEELLLTITNILESRRILKEKYADTFIYKNSRHKLEINENIKFLSALNDIIHAEITNEELNASFLARRMSMSISQLSRKLNGITGFSTISYVLQIKLSKAKKMLTESNVTVADVSDACGFYDSNYFSRVFKKEFGVTPSQFQKMDAGSFSRINQE